MHFRIKPPRIPTSSSGNRDRGHPYFLLQVTALEAGLQGPMKQLRRAGTGWSGTPGLQGQAEVPVSVYSHSAQALRCDNIQVLAVRRRKVRGGGRPPAAGILAAMGSPRWGHHFKSRML